MEERGGAILWFIAGGLAGFSLASVMGFGSLLLLPALTWALLLLMLRVPGGWAWLTGAGIASSAAWLSLALDPNAPGDSLWPLFVGAGAAAVGFFMLLRQPTKGVPAP